MLSTYARGSSVPIESTIDLENIRNWRRACRNTHGDCCNDDHAGTLAQHIDRLTLVDVFNGSLVILSTSSPITYVALPYVWGAVPMFKTKRSNIDILLQPGALYNKQNGIVLPDTIRDAIYLAKALGERYVWVDCLSTVQDTCSEEMEITLRAMARIYASADFMVVASDGNDADHGLRGVGGPSKNRIPSPNPTPIYGVPTQNIRNGRLGAGRFKNLCSPVVSSYLAALCPGCVDAVSGERASICSDVQKISTPLRKMNGQQSVRILAYQWV